MKKIALLLMVALAQISVWAQEQEFEGRHAERDGFVWVCEKVGDFMQALDDNGNVLIPADRGYTSILYMGKPQKGDEYYSKKVAQQWEPWFNVSITVNDTVYSGACDLDGREIVPPAFLSCLGYINDGLRYVHVTTHKLWQGIYLWDGRMLIAPMYKEALFFGGRFVGDLQSKFPLSNKVKDMLKQQELLNAAIENGVNTDPMLAYADSIAESDPKAAIQEYKKIILQKPSAEAYFKRAKCHYRRDDYKEALEDLHYTMFLDDGTPKIYEEAFELLQKAEDYRINELIERQQRLEMAAAIMNSVSSAMNSISNTIATYKGVSPANTSSGFTNYLSYSNFNAPTTSSTQTNTNVKSAHQRRCSSCGGDGKCRSGRYACRGTRECKVCLGNGYNTASGHSYPCSACHGSRSCAQCNGTGQCQRCKGTGTL